MATTYHNDLQKLYVAYFNRPADAGGLAHYEGVLETAAANGGASAVASMMDLISADFAKSTEYQTTYNQATNAGVITAVYQNLFGRPVDEQGLAFYVKALTDKKMTIDTMVTFIANGATGTDKTIIESKVAVATAFTNAMDKDAEKTAYAAKEAQAAAKELLSTIKTTADATNAVAKIDDHVAAVVKAGTPFSLESGLASLGEAQADLAAFLKAEKATAAAIRNEVTKADTALAKEITVGAYANASAGVKTALIADQVAYNDKALEAANDALEAAQAAVAKVTGLSDAIATATSAADVAEEASDAAVAAVEEYVIAQTAFAVRAKGTTSGAFGTADFKVIGEDGKTVAVMKDGALVVADKIDATKYAGLTDLVAAANDRLAASAEATSASDASLIAQLHVESLENPTAKLSAVFTAADFAKTKGWTGTGEPTLDQIADELAARVAANDGTAGAFRSKIIGYNGTHETLLSDAVIAAEKGNLALAKADVAAEEGLNEAVALIDAEKNVDTTKAAVATTASIDASGNVTLTATPTTKLATVGANGKLVLESGVSASAHAGLAEYIAAFNAEVDAQAAYNAAETGVTAQAFVLQADNAALLKAVKDQEAFITVPAPSATDTSAAGKLAYANYIKALGVDGAQAEIDELDEAVSGLEEATATAAELKSLEDAVKAATADFTDHDFNAPVMLEGASTSFFGKTGSDIFVVAGEDKLAMTIGNFGRSGDDVLFIGNGYSLNKGDPAKDGDNSVLEVFFTKSGNNTIVTIETETFSSNSTEPEIKITLTGVDAADLHFENGIISI